MVEIEESEDGASKAKLATCGGEIRNAKFAFRFRASLRPEETTPRRPALSNCVIRSIHRLKKTIHPITAPMRNRWFDYVLEANLHFDDTGEITEQTL
jgi:hypothetical protein